MNQTCQHQTIRQSIISFHYGPSPLLWSQSPCPHNSPSVVSVELYSHAALLTLAKLWKQPLAKNKLLDQETTVHVHKETMVHVHSAL